MKLKGKLILSCAALAAVATTAFSTTYAWYTSNTEVNAKGLKASTATANDSSLQISLDGKNDWGASVSLAAITKNLTPVQRVASDAGVVGKYTTQNNNGTTNPVTQVEKPADSGTYVDAEDATSAANIVQFDLYFRNVTIANSTTCPVYIKDAVIVNQQAGGVATKLLADLNGSYTANTYSTYKVDLLRALRLEIVGIDTSAVEGDDAKVDMSDSLTLTPEMTSHYSLEKYMDTANNPDTLYGKTGWDALTYYNKVKGLYGNYKAATGWSATKTYYTRSGAGTDASPYTFAATTIANETAYTAAAANLFEFDPTLTNDSTAVRPDTQTEPAKDLKDVLNDAASKIGTIQSNKQILKTTWTLYLDGWDTACYDACKGQNISIDFTFTSKI